MAHEEHSGGLTADVLDHADRSPSPVTPPPVAATPGPRATALQRLYADAIAHVLKTCNYTNFASCFPTPATEQPDSLRHLHAQFTERLGSSMRLNFEQILIERNVIHSLNELDRLIEEAKNRRIRAQETSENPGLPTPPHTLPARQLYLSHLAPSLSQQSQTLKERQDTLSEDNIETLQKVMQQRKQIADLVKGLSSAVEDVERAAEVLGTEDIDALRDENRALDEEMKDMT